MKICILTHTFPRNKKDTAAAFMKEFSDGLVEVGNKVIVVTPFDTEFKRQEDPFKIVTYKYIWPPFLHLLGYSKTMEADIKLRKKAFLLLPFLLFFGTLALYKVAREERIDIINVHWIIPNGIMALIVSKLTGVPFVITLPGTDAYLAYRYKTFGWVAKIIAQSSQGIISNSSWHLKRILNLGVKNKRTEVISYPVSVSSFRPVKRGLDKLRKELGVEKDDFLVLAVGRFVYKKGFNYLIEAIAEVYKKHSNVRLIIGGDGDLRADWEKLAQDLNIGKIVLFVGNIPRDEIIYYYNLADAMVAPSIVDEKGNVDGGPVVSFESMACGKPQVVTNILGVADVIKDNINGFVVPEKDPHSLAVALEKLIKSASLRKKMGEANRRVIKSELNTRRIGKKYTAFFKQSIPQNTE